ncbi:MAG: PQQ-binding-like beta-propeller repeat protein [Spirochaetota bacterium]
MSIISIILSFSLAASDWPTYKGNLYFTGNNDEIIVKNNSLKWLFMASNYIFNPIVSDGMVLFSDLDKMIYCLDEETGRALWTFDMKAYSSRFGSAATVAGKVKYPIIKDNFLFLSDATAIYCLDKNKGAVIWARAGHQEGDKRTLVIDSIYADPIISGDNIFYGTRKNFIARSVRNGHVVWANSAIESFSGFPNFYDDKIFAQSRDFKKNTFFVSCLDQRTGKALWQRQIDNPLQIFSPVVYQGNVYMPSGKKLYCLSLSDGAIRWQKEYDEPITSCPSFTESDIILTFGNQRTAVLSPENGAIRFSLESGEKSSPQSVTVRDQMYIAHNFAKQVGGRDMTFTALKAYTFGTEKPLWEFDPPFPGGASQPSASKGAIFLPAGNYLYAVGTYYDRAITFGNDGSSDFISNTNTASNTNLIRQSNIIVPVRTNEKAIVLDDVKKGETVVVPNIYFEFNRSYLLKQSIETLDNIAAQLKRNPKIQLEIQGHTDSVGDAAYNQTLSEKRAKAVMDYLVKNGISPERLRAVGYGMKKPIAENSTAEGRGKNRRTEFLLLEK